MKSTNTEISSACSPVRTKVSWFVAISTNSTCDGCEEGEIGPVWIRYIDYTEAQLFIPCPTCRERSSALALIVRPAVCALERAAQVVDLASVVEVVGDHD